MQITSTVTYHFIHTGFKKKCDNNKGWWGCGAKEVYLDFI